MRPLTTELLTHLLQDALTHQDALQHPRLAVFVADFQAALQRLSASSGPGQLDDPELQAAQTQARAADVVHDDAHRALFWLLTAFATHGRAEDRALVARAVEVLYPDGLALNQLSYAAEAGATEGFAERLQDPAVQAGLGVMAASVADLPQWTEACVQAGRALGQAVQAIDLRLAALKAAGPSPAAGQFRARNETRRLWNLYLESVDLAYPASRAESGAVRTRLRQAWERLQAGH